MDINKTRDRVIEIYQETHKQKLDIDSILKFIYRDEFLEDMPLQTMVMKLLINILNDQLRQLNGHISAYKNYTSESDKIEEDNQIKAIKAIRSNYEEIKNILINFVNENEIITEYLKDQKTLKEFQLIRKERFKQGRPIDFDYKEIFKNIVKIRDKNKNDSIHNILKNIALKYGMHHTTIPGWIKNNKRHLPNYAKYKNLRPSKILEIAPLEDLLGMIDNYKKD